MMDPEKTKTDASPKPPTDMSPEAIDRRLRELSELYALGREIRSARWLGTLEELAERGSRNRE